MFLAEKDFKQTLQNTDGFCLEHFGSLLRYASFAGRRKKDYIYTLTSLEKKSMEKLLTDLQRFAAKHDYRNADLPWEGAEKALERSVVKLHGEQAK